METQFCKPQATTIFAAIYYRAACHCIEVVNVGKIIAANDFGIMLSARYVSYM